MMLESIHIHPLKSARALSLDDADVEARGLAGDRRWMVVDAGGKFVSARRLPAMVLIDARVDAGGALSLSMPGHAPLHAAAPSLTEATIDVEVWSSHCPARVADAAANAWIARMLGGDFRLAHMADDCLRAVTGRGAAAGDIVSFADGYPLLLIGTASLDELNRRASRPVAMANFRPNLVVRTDVPFVEDTWQRIRVGAVEFDVSKPCVRCVLTTVDPATGIKAADGEPLATLKMFRRHGDGVTFGQNLIPRGHGKIAVGDAVNVGAA
jgi:uncharacterized protein YcbX